MFDGIEPQPIVGMVGSKGAVGINCQTSLVNKGIHV